MRKLIALSALLLFGCSHQNSDDQEKFHNDGRCKPCMALVPVYDHTAPILPWNLSEEFTHEIAQNLRSDLYVNELFSLAGERSVFTDPSLLEEHSPDVEFIALVELVSHQFTPRSPAEYDAGNKSALDLEMTLRVKVIDMRVGTSEVILQELIHQDNYIPKLLAGIDYNSKAWGTSFYKLTPIGRAHHKLIQTVSKRLHDYILLAKSR